MPNDITYTDLPTETIIHPGTPKGAAWIAKYVTTNVTDIHYAGEEGKTRAKGLIADMRGDGLEVTQRLEGEVECPGHTADTDCEIDPDDPCEACNAAEDARLARQGK